MSRMWAQIAMLVANVEREQAAEAARQAGERIVAATERDYARYEAYMRDTHPAWSPEWDSFMEGRGGS